MAKGKYKPVFTASERSSIISLSCILFFRMFGVFLVLPVFSVLAMEELEFANKQLTGLAFAALPLSQAFLQIPFGIWSDRMGRKLVISIGLILFITGSVMAALVENVYWMIFARFLQGTGAISSPIFALIADLTRPEVRARANAGLGAGVGLAFGFAFFIAPFFGKWFGLSGIFWIISATALMSLIVLIVSVPTPERMVLSRQKNIFVMIRESCSNFSLRVIYFGGFLCGAGLSMTMFMTPLVLKEYGWPKEDLWKLYLPLLFLGGATMIPCTILAEAKNRFREVMVGGSVFLLISFLLFYVSFTQNSQWLFITALCCFFMGFNIFEPIFPSLVTRMTTTETKGTASGVYNFFQFFGHAAGGASAGAFLAWGPAGLPPVFAVVSLLLIALTWRFPNPQRRLVSV